MYFFLFVYLSSLLLFFQISSFVKIRHLFYHLLTAGGVLCDWTASEFKIKTGFVSPSVPVFLVSLLSGTHDSVALVSVHSFFLKAVVLFIISIESQVRNSLLWLYNIWLLLAPIGSSGNDWVEQIYSTETAINSDPPRTYMVLIMTGNNEH